MILLLTPLSHQAWAEQRVSWGEDGSPTPHPEPLKVDSLAPRADRGRKVHADRGRLTGCRRVSVSSASLCATSAVSLSAGCDHAVCDGL